MSTDRNSLRLILVLVALLATSDNASAVVPPVVRYGIHVTLDVSHRKLIGQETVLYKTGADVPLREVYFHLYPNALANRHSTMGLEMESIYGDYTVVHAQPWELSRLDIASLTVNGLASQFDIDGTSLRVGLAQPLQPGDSLLLDINFVTMVPSLPGRFRTRDGDFSIAQWYPKVAVYDQTGWHHDSYHLLGEFYGEFATYDVRITLPQDYYVGATGTFVSSEDGDNNMPALLGGEDAAEARHAKLLADVKHLRLSPAKTLQFHADHVHDFAWVASPDYVVDKQDWHGIKLQALVLRNHAESKWKNLLSYEISAVRFFTERVGEYPYPSLTVAEAFNFPAGAMEYPELVMIDPAMSVPMTHALEYVAVHEIGHNWFYGALANNELDDPWLDEGFEEYFTLRYAQQAYPDGSTFDVPAWMSWFLDLPYRWTHEINYRLLQSSGHDLSVAQAAYRFSDERGYEAIIYSKGALVLGRLRDLVGDTVFRQIMKTYYSEFKFKHVTIADFVNVASRVAGRDLNTFFDQALRQTGGLAKVIVKSDFSKSSMSPVKFARPLDYCAFADPDRFVIALEPTVWYNDVDGLRLGTSLKSSYLLTYHTLSAGVNYGASSGRTGYRVHYSTPILKGPALRFAIEAADDEGMRSYSVHLGNEQPANVFLSIFGAEQSRYPFFRSTVSLEYRDRYAPAYFDQKFYTLGKTTVVNLAGTYAQQGYEGLTKIDYAIGQGLDALEAHANFTRGYLNVQQDIRLVRTGEIIATVRGAAGIMSKSAPKQERFAIGFGIPESTIDPIRRFFASGGGGVRAYQRAAALGHRLLAASLELSSERYSIGIPYIEPRLFFDIGRVDSQSSSELTNRTLCDAGLELRAFDIVQLSFPVWRSSPEAGSTQLDFRVVARITIPR